VHDSQHDDLLIRHAEVDGIREAAEADPPYLAMDALERFGGAKQ